MPRQAKPETQAVIFRQSIAGHRQAKDGQPANLYSYHVGDEAELPYDEAVKLRDKDIVSFKEDE